MTYFAVVRSDDNIVDNVVNLQGGAWAAPEGHYLVEFDGFNYGIGWAYDPVTEQWTPPPSISVADAPPTDGPTVL